MLGEINIESLTALGFDSSQSGALGNLDINVSMKYFCLLLIASLFVGTSLPITWGTAMRVTLETASVYLQKTILYPKYSHW